MRLPHTVTLFQPSGRTVLTGVLLESTRGTSVTKTAQNSADSVTLHIPLPFAQIISPEKDYFARGDVPDEGSYQKCRESTRHTALQASLCMITGACSIWRWAADDTLLYEAAPAQQRA